LGQLRLLRWCAHEAKEKSEEGHFESKAPTCCYFKVRKVFFLCAGATKWRLKSRSIAAGPCVLRFGPVAASQVVR